MEKKEIKNQQKSTLKLKLQGFMQKPWVRAITNPHLLISIGIAWFITNGWSYCALGFGVYFEIAWLRNLGTFWLGLLWLPGTPEKLLTFALAIGILRLLFPDDTRTLTILRQKRRQLHEKVSLDYQKLKAKLSRKKKD